MNKRYFVANLVFGFAVCIFGAASLLAQAPENGVPVHTVVTVEPHKGSGTPVINREDVMVYEGKARDRVTEWVPAQAEHAALELFILLDDGSDQRIGNQLDDIRKFILGQPVSTLIGIAYMQNGIARVEQNPTSDHAQAAKALRLPAGVAGANGSPYFSLSDLIKRWPATAARRAVVMATDGIDYQYSDDLQNPYVTAAIGDAQRAGIVVSAIYTPGVGHSAHSHWQTYWGQLYLSQVAERTGGEAYYIGFSGPPVTFAPYLDDVARHLSEQYLLTFLAKPPKKAGLQHIKIKTEVPHVDLVSADAVYVPAP